MWRSWHEKVVLDDNFLMPGHKQTRADESLWGGTMNKRKGWNPSLAVVILALVFAVGTYYTLKKAATTANKRAADEIAYQRAALKAEREAQQKTAYADAVRRECVRDDVPWRVTDATADGKVKEVILPASGKCPELFFGHVEQRKLWNLTEIAVAFTGDGGIIIQPKDEFPAEFLSDGAHYFGTDRERFRKQVMLDCHVLLDEAHPAFLMDVAPESGYILQLVVTDPAQECILDTKNAPGWTNEGVKKWGFASPANAGVTLLHWEDPGIAPDFFAAPGFTEVYERQLQAARAAKEAARNHQPDGANQEMPPTEGHFLMIPIPPEALQ